MAPFDGTSQRVNDPLGVGDEGLKPGNGGTDKPEAKSGKSDKGDDKLQPLKARGGSSSGSGTGATTG